MPDVARRRLSGSKAIRVMIPSARVKEAIREVLQSRGKSIHCRAAVRFLVLRTSAVGAADSFQKSAGSRGEEFNVVATSHHDEVAVIGEGNQGLIPRTKQFATASAQKKRCTATRVCRPGGLTWLG